MMKNKVVGITAMIFLLMANIFYYGVGFSKKPGLLQVDNVLVDTQVEYLDKLPKWLTFSSSSAPMNTVNELNNLFTIEEVIDDNLPPSVLDASNSRILPIDVEPAPIEINTFEFSKDTLIGIEVLAINYSAESASCLLKVAGDIVVVGEGDKIDEQYRIQTITADTVYLEAL